MGWPNMKILIVDDEPVSRRVLREILASERGHQISEVEDGDEAWAMLDNPARYFDVVFLDVSMPKSDGFEVLDRIRESPILRSLRVVMCTSARDKETVEKVIQLGARHFVVKPASAPLVLAKLRQIAAEIASDSAAPRTMHGAQNRLAAGRTWR
jgi:CheY-like chemotaxis protein